MQINRTVALGGFFLAASALYAGPPGVVVDHQPTRSGGPFADTAFLDMFGDPQWQFLADDILLNSLATIRSVRWWGFYDQDNPPASETFRMRFYDARPSDGLPGNVLFEESFLDPAREGTGQIVFTGVDPQEHVYFVELVTPFDLAANTPYWLEITQIGDLSTGFRWEDSVSGNREFAFRNSIFPDWDIATQSELAFQLSTIPEPSTFILLLLAAAPFGRRCRSCRRP